MNEKISITLPAELVAAINEQVELGHYASTSDMLQQAVQRLVDKEQFGFEPDMDQIRKRVRESLEDTRPPIPLEETRSHLDEFVSRLYQNR